MKFPYPKINTCPLWEAWGYYTSTYDAGKQLLGVPSFSLLHECFHLGGFHLTWWRSSLSAHENILTWRITAVGREDCPARVLEAGLGTSAEVFAIQSTPCSAHPAGRSGVQPLFHRLVTHCAVHPGVVSALLLRRMRFCVVHCFWPRLCYFLFTCFFC